MGTRPVGPGYDARIPPAGPKYVRTTSGIDIDEVYDSPPDPTRIGRPGEYPFTRGPYPSMYRGKPW
ncbi:MAG: methylmalonyl-CoA mutase family protein, partial [Acidimicrobiia bacterium]|nr:methylmalonyl-CoA mutase family protein [Acidimicrobiia bacterium]